MTTINNICHANKDIIRLTETLCTSLLTLPNSIYITLGMRTGLDLDSLGSPVLPTINSCRSAQSIVTYFLTDIVVYRQNKGGERAYVRLLLGCNSLWSTRVPKDPGRLSCQRFQFYTDALIQLISTYRSSVAIGHPKPRINLIDIASECEVKENNGI